MLVGAPFLAFFFKASHSSDNNWRGIRTNIENIEMERMGLARAASSLTLVLEAMQVCS